MSTSSNPVGLASCLWLVRTVPYLDTASGHEPPLYALLVTNSSPSVVNNGDRPGAMKCRFLQQASSYKSVVCTRVRVDLSIHEYVLSLYELLVLLSSDGSRPLIRGKLSF